VYSSKNIEQKLLIVAEDGKEHEVVTRLARVGYDHSIGFLKGGFETWEKAGLRVETLPSISVEEFESRYAQNPDMNILDVRKESEYFSEHMVKAENTPLDYIQDNLSQIDPNKSYYVHCAGGYRSVVFASLLKNKGFDNLINVEGGFDAIKKTGKVEVTDYVCPTTML